MDLTCSLEAGSNISLTGGIQPGITGICEGRVIGVDSARGVTIWVIPGKVLICIGCAGPYIPAKEVPLYCGPVVALSLITLKPTLNLPYKVPFTQSTAYMVVPYL